MKRIHSDSGTSAVLTAACLIIIIISYNTTAHAADWMPMTSGTANQLNSIWGNSALNIFAVGNAGTILYYNGSEWRSMDSGVSDNLTAVWGSADNNVFAVGNAGVILRYNGNTWTPMDSKISSELLGIWGNSGNNVFAVGRAGVILHYNGSSWAVMDSGTQVALFGIWGISDADIFTAGQAGGFLHYDGNAWTAMNHVTSSICYTIWGFSATEVFAAGDYGNRLYCDETGWHRMDSDSNIENHFRDIWGSSKDNLFAVANDGAIFHYDGTTWTSMNSGTSTPLKSIWGSSDNNIFAVGANGTILHKGIDYAMTVTAPNTQDKWYATQAYTISWQTDGPDNETDIYLNKGGTRKYTLAANAPNIGEYQWTIPAETLNKATDQDDDYTIVICTKDCCGESKLFGIYYPCPPAPTDFKAAPESHSEITLSWGSAYGATGFEIYDCFTNTPIPSDNVTFYNNSAVISGLEPETWYNYKLRAVNTSCESEFTYCRGAGTPSYPPMITSVSPETAISDEPTTFIVKGEYLIAGMEFQTEQCMGTKELSGGTPSERYFQCTPDDAGKKAGWIKDSPDGNLIYSFTVEVVEPVLNTLAVPDMSALDYFGDSVAMSDEYAAVSATAQLNPDKAGAVYMFRRNAEITTGWQYETQLMPSDSMPGDDFGRAVSVSGNCMIVSSKQGDYIFRHNGMSWVEEAKLNGSDGRFGNAVAIFGNYAVVQGGYVFHYDGISWKQQAKLNTGDGLQSLNGFGCSVSVYGDYVIVGACLESDNGMNDTGAAYVFKRNQTNWILQSKLTPSDALSDDAFGKSVAIYEDYAIVGSPSSGAYIFKQNNNQYNNQWEHIAKLTMNDSPSGDNMGQSVSICGNYAVISTSDAVCVFRKPDSEWLDMTETFLVPKPELGNEGADQALGITVSMNKDYIFIGNMGNSENGAGAGKAYSYGPFSSQMVADTSSPVTTASPDGGVFASNQEIVLTCYDAGYSGCANIFYTTDGTDPDRSSTPYSNPIPVTEQMTDQLTLKFFSADHSDNAESVRTEIYMIDTESPFIRTDAPQDGDLLDSFSSIKGTASDTRGGLANVELKITDGKWFLTQSESGDKYFTKNEKWIAAAGLESWSLDFTNVYYRFNTPYTIIAKATDKAGNSSESDTVIFQIKGTAAKDSEITCELSRSDVMVIGESLVISGVILPEPNRVSGVNIALISPNGQIINEPTLANIEGEFSYKLPCGVILEHGIWQIQTSWAGDQSLTDAESKIQYLEVSKAESDIRLDVTSESVKIGEKITFSGKFLPRPYCNGGIQDISISFTLTSPDGDEMTFSAEPDEKGHFKFENFSDFHSLGKWKIKAEFKGNDAYNASVSQAFEVSVRETAGYAIIVQGKISSEEGIQPHLKTADFVYKTLKHRYILDDDILYLNYDTNPSEDMEIDDVPSKESIRDAITQWAKDKINEKPANLYIVMVDHGGTDTFFIDPDIISAKDLKEWLDTLQAGLTGDAAEQEIAIILGFCRSGSFIDDLSGAHRIIITSAAENESSYKGALDQDNIRDGEFFISEFFKTVSLGKSVKKSFEEAVVLTERFTYSQALDNTVPPYHDNALQHPLLDDNGDGKGSNDLSGFDGDGNLSNAIIVGVSQITANHPGDVSITHAGAEPKILINEGELPFLWAKADDVDRVTTVWCEVKPPNYSLINHGEEEQLEMNLTKKVWSQYNSATNQYEWLFSADNPDDPDFSEPGMYQIFFFAKDFHTGNVSSPAEARIYRAKVDNQPPDSFSLVSPENGTSISPTYFKDEDVYLMVLDWEDTTDPDGDNFSYTVMLSKTETFDDVIQIEGITTGRSLIRLPAEWVDNKEVFWKVQAIDAYGAVRESDAVWGFYAINDNNSAFIEIYILNCLNQQPINNADVTVAVGKETENIPLKEEGKYSNLINLYGNNEAQINLKANEYRTLNKFINIEKGDFLVLNFKLVPESFTPLQTAISVLQAISELRGSEGSACISDINNDGKIGLEEVVYLLQNVVLLRE